MTDRLTPPQMTVTVREFIDAFKQVFSRIDDRATARDLLSSLIQKLEEEAARREAEATQGADARKLDQDDIDRLLGFDTGAGLRGGEGEREGPGSAAAPKRQGEEVMPTYYLEMRCGCTLVRARNARRVETWARREFGEMNAPHRVQLATKEHIANVEAMGGRTHEL